MGKFDKIEELKQQMYASKEWKESVLRALDIYHKNLHEQIPIRTYYDYCVWQEDILYQHADDVFFGVRAVYPEFTPEQFKAWWDESIDEWEKINGYGRYAR